MEMYATKQIKGLKCINCGSPTCKSLVNQMCCICRNRGLKFDMKSINNNSIKSYCDGCNNPRSTRVGLSTKPSHIILT